MTATRLILLASVASACFAGQASAYCREYTSQVSVGGNPQETFGQACQNPDGSWAIQDEQQGGIIPAATSFYYNQSSGGYGAPGYVAPGYAPAPVYASPYYAAPAPVYVAPPVYAPAPVYAAPVYAAPTYVTPAPYYGSSFGFGYSSGRNGGGHRGNWRDGRGGRSFGGYGGNYGRHW